jgi:hypothetical protein
MKYLLHRADRKFFDKKNIFYIQIERMTAKTLCNKTEIIIKLLLGVRNIE